MVVREELDWIQNKLQDRERIWTRAELLRYYNDGYMALMSKSACVTRMTILDVPGRFTFTYTHEWEANSMQGTSLKITYSCYAGTMQCIFLWEAQQLDGIVPVNSQAGVTQLWEITALSGTTDHHFTFALPKSHDHIKRIAWDDQELYPVSVRELDASDRIWYYAAGEPAWWTMGVGKFGTFEIYEIRTDYSQGYELKNYQRGIPRQITGDRTYSIPTGFVIGGFFGQAIFGLTPFGGGGAMATMGLGTIREIVSTERQYLPMMSGAAPSLIQGGIRDFKSSVKSVQVNETVIPDMDLKEQDTADLLPSRMQKYIRYYVLSEAYSKQGEGQRQDLAVHWEGRFKRGIAVLNRLANLASRDRDYRREEITEIRVRPPRVRLPVHYPPVLY